MTEIEVGGAGEAPKVVTLPAWQNTTFNGTFTMTGFPAELQGQVGFIAHHGAGVLDNGYIQFMNDGVGTASANLWTYQPNFGLEWWRFLQAYDEPLGAERTVYAQSWQSVGHPLAVTHTLTYDSMLASPEVELVDRTIGIAGITDDAIDRVVTTVRIEGDNVWRIWSPPDVTAITLPTTPAEVAWLAFGTVIGLTVRLEDAEDIDGYADAFDYFRSDIAVDALDPLLGRSRAHRLAERYWKP